MIKGERDEENMGLMPLKRRLSGDEDERRSRQAKHHRSRIVQEYEFEGTGIAANPWLDLCLGEPLGPDATPPRAAGNGTPFEEWCEWKWTKSTCAGLFKTLAKHYDELWFPTVVKELGMLYYRCNYADDYWPYRAEWLAGDEEVRLAVWSQIIKYRNHKDELADERRRRNAGRSDQIAELMRMYATDNEDDVFKIVEMHEAVNEADDLITLKKMDEDNMDCRESMGMNAAEKAQAEMEAAELALADPDDDPDWVEMRRRMRGSFAALNQARTSVSLELLDHLMIEICKYWSKAPAICDEMEPLLERNIVREIQKFRFKLFGVTVDTEPERLPSDQTIVDSESSQQQPPCPSPSPSPRLACSAPEKNPRSARGRGGVIRPATNKLAEARARKNRECSKQ